MIGKEKLFAKLERVLDQSRAEQTEIVFVGSRSGLTRYANSYIHQNVFEDDARIFFRTVVGKRVGVASTNSLVTADLRQALADSLEIGRQQPENPDFPGLPKPARYRDLFTFDPDTAAFGPKDRAKAVKRIITEASRKKFTVAGSCATSSGEVAILNSLGVRAYQPFSGASVNMIVMSDTSSGYAGTASRRVADLDFVSLAKTAVEKCDRSQNPIEVEPGDYEVILEPAATVEILEWLNYIGFNSKSFQQKMSFLAGKIGRKITSEKISFYDDALNERGMAFPFDFEGVPKKKVMFVQKGVARGVVHDSASARKSRTKSTGHALTPDEANEGAYAMNMFMGAGTARRDKMISKVKRGILVTRFHYINGLIDTRNSVLTGMTRDGTFLIEDGEIKQGIKNLRFTDSITRAFKSAVAVSREIERPVPYGDGLGCVSAPTIHLGSFRFSGKTDF